MYFSQYVRYLMLFIMVVLVMQAYLIFRWLNYFFWGSGIVSVCVFSFLGKPPSNLKSAY